MNRLWKGILYDKDGTAGGGTDDGKGDPSKDKGTVDVKPVVLDWDTWHGTLPKAAQKLIAAHESGLKTALGSERDARGKAEGDLRNVAKKLEEGSEAQKEVLKLADDVAVGNTKADFYEEAHAAGVSNLKLAYHVAVTEELFDKRGNVDFAKMKETFPELFGKAPIKPKTNAGDGTDTDLGQTADMNAYIRKAAGRR